MIPLGAAVPLARNHSHTKIHQISFLEQKNILIIVAFVRLWPSKKRKVAGISLFEAIFGRFGHNSDYRHVCKNRLGFYRQPSK